MGEIVSSEYSTLGLRAVFSLSLFLLKDVIQWSNDSNRALKKFGGGGVSRERIESFKMEENDFSINNKRIERKKQRLGTNAENY